MRRESRHSFSQIASRICVSGKNPKRIEARGIEELLNTKKQAFENEYFKCQSRLYLKNDIYGTAFATCF